MKISTREKQAELKAIIEDSWAALNAAEIPLKKLEDQLFEEDDPKAKEYEKDTKTLLQRHRSFEDRLRGFRRTVTKAEIENPDTSGTVYNIEGDATIYDIDGDAEINHNTGDDVTQVLGSDNTTEK